jgi:phosphoglycerate dehydrogenase-like enzyme
LVRTCSHIPNPADDTGVAFTLERMTATVSRAPNAGRLDISFASDDAGFAAAMREAEALLTCTRIVMERVPVGALPSCAPRRQVIACNSAGLDRLAPFDWLRPEIRLLNHRGTRAKKVGEFALRALLMSASHIPHVATAEREERWVPRFGSVLAGRTV